MIDPKIIKIANNSKYAGLKNIFTHKSTIKNSICGDLIKLEIIAKNKKIESMRYETESCILCEASASMLAKKVKKYYLKSLKNDIKQLKKNIKDNNSSLPNKFKNFKLLLEKSNLNRVKCVMLPFEGLLKAFNVKK